MEKKQTPTLRKKVNKFKKKQKKTQLIFKKWKLTVNKSIKFFLLFLNFFIFFKIIFVCAFTVHKIKIDLSL